MQSSTLESATSHVAAGLAVRSRRSFAWLRQWRRVKIYLGGLIVLTLIVVGVLGPLVAPYDPSKQELTAMRLAPQWFGGAYFFGTDNLGRDILSRLLYGARVSLVIAFAVVLISGFIGVALGAISGYFGGRVDFVIQKFVEVIWAFPPLLLAIAIMAYLGQSLFNLILALVAQRWIQYCRVVRGQTLSLRTRDFVMAARVVGASDMRVIYRHLLPNVIPVALVIGTFAMAMAIIAEASLSFLGLGVPPEIPTWGTMLSDGRIYISTAWWLSFFPGLCIFLTVLGINLLGDGLRDVLDPRTKKAAGV